MQTDFNLWANFTKRYKTPLEGWLALLHDHKEMKTVNISTFGKGHQSWNQTKS